MAISTLQILYQKSRKRKSHQSKIIHPAIFVPQYCGREIHPTVISNAMRNPFPLCFMDFSSFHSSKWHLSTVISNLFHFLTPVVTRDYWWNIAPLRGAPRWNRGEGVNPRHRKRSPSPSGRNFLPNILLQERSQGIFFWISRRFTPRNDITVISNAVRNPYRPVLDFFPRSEDPRLRRDVVSLLEMTPFPHHFDLGIKKMRKKICNFRKNKYNFDCNRNLFENF